jgi:hypothetical protein
VILLVAPARLAQQYHSVAPHALARWAKPLWQSALTVAGVDRSGEGSGGDALYSVALMGRHAKHAGNTSLVLGSVYVYVWKTVNVFFGTWTDLARLEYTSPAFRRPCELLQSSRTIWKIGDEASERDCFYKKKPCGFSSVGAPFFSLWWKKTHQAARSSDQQKPKPNTKGTASRPRRLPWSLRPLQVLSAS